MEKLTLEQKLDEMIKAAGQSGFVAGLNFISSVIEKTILELESKENE